MARRPWAICPGTDLGWLRHSPGRSGPLGRAGGFLDEPASHQPLGEPAQHAWAGSGADRVPIPALVSHHPIPTDTPPGAGFLRAPPPSPTSFFPVIPLACKWSFPSPLPLFYNMSSPEECRGISVLLLASVWAAWLTLL